MKEVRMWNRKTMITIFPMFCWIFTHECSYLFAIMKLFDKARNPVNLDFKQIWQSWSFCPDISKNWIQIKWWTLTTVWCARTWPRFLREICAGHRSIVWWRHDDVLMTYGCRSNDFRQFLLFTFLNTMWPPRNQSSKFNSTTIFRKFVKMVWLDPDPDSDDVICRAVHCWIV